MPARIRTAPHSTTKSLSSFKDIHSSPQWMKTLEDRYQRLHMKIVYNTSTTTVGRQVNEQTLVRSAINRARSTSNVRYSSAKLAVTHKNGYGLNKRNVYNLIGNKLDIGNFSISQRKHLLYQRKNQDTFGNDVYAQRQTVQRCEATTESPSRDSTAEQSSDKKSIKHREEANLEQLNEIENVFGEDKDTGKEFEEPGQEFLKTREKRGKSLGMRAFNRLSKTSVSRTSNNTSTSCPAAIESFPSSHPTITERHSLTNHRLASGTRRTRGFRCMSSEAQHAMTETINASQTAISQDSVYDDETYNGDIVPSDFVKKPVFKKCATTLDHVRYMTDARSIRNDVNHSDCHSDSEFSRAELPEIYTDVLDGQEKVFTSKTLSHSHYIIPGIGRFNFPIPNDSTFEITPPGYDIRYKDVIKVEDRESETPPPDIREKAIQKCTDWLNRYIRR